MLNVHIYNFIYKTTNLKNDKFYIGMHSTSNLGDGYIGSGKELRNSVRYWGKENHSFVILEYFPNRKSLINREKEIVDEALLENPKCMNIALGGEGGSGFINEDHMKKCCNAGNEKFKELLKDPEYKKEFSKKTKGSETWKRLHKEGRVKYDTFTNKKHSEESKKKIGETNSFLQSGEKNSQYGKVWIFNYDKKISRSINKEELDKYIGEGWRLGSLNKGKTNITEEQAREIKRLHSEGISERKIASKIETSRTTVSSIIRKKSWKGL